MKKERIEMIETEKGKRCVGNWVSKEICEYFCEGSMIEKLIFLRIDMILWKTSQRKCKKNSFIVSLS